MIVVRKERIYNIDVYTFKSTNGTPYQLTFELNDSGRYHDISLVNLTGQSDSKYCPELRTTISEIIFDFLLEKKCVLYFNVEYGSKNKLRLIFKFLRWIRLEKRVSASIELTKVVDLEFLELKIKLAPDFIRQIKVN